ncbi:hypothetical protein WN55_02563 [Dufourea novaeangliae]|uniref:Tc1-like transposase DDE domain-containing protein n=1 Tax=Dufourea novaeangliae TaxID=178035 RepID=A0A154PJ54_DUFNO|nr:hypothetical protein WN55_02563 [Dufourea novaeangliae]
MQDGARPHRTNDTFDLLSEHFGNNVIALDYPNRTGQGIDWPPYSPDLNTLDYFFWGFLKDNLYKDMRTPISTIEEIKNRITTLISNVDIETLKNAIRGFQSRLRHVVVSEGGRFENLIN